MAIVFFGTPSFAVPSLEALLDSGEEVAAVVTRRDAPRGRSRAPSPPPVKELALKHGIKVLQPARMKDEAFVDELRSLAPEFIAVVAYGRILTREIMSVPQRMPVNVHASLLPKYRGASPIAWAIINGERETGVTTMVMAEELDAGDILMQEKTPITDEDTAESLGAKLSVMGAGLLVKTLAGVRDGSVKPSPQRGGPTFAPPLKKEFGHIDWQKTARELFDFVRGIYPWPGAYAFLGGKRIKITRAAPLEGRGTPGEVLDASAEGIAVGTGGGLLLIKELQPEGGRKMPVAAYLQGHPVRKGDWLV